MDLDKRERLLEIHIIRGRKKEALKKRTLIFKNKEWIT